VLCFTADEEAGGTKGAGHLVAHHRDLLDDCTVAVGEYRPTAKNEQVKDFYPNHAFRRVAGNPELHYFELDLTSFDGLEPPYFHRIDTQFQYRAKVGSQ